MRAFVAIELTTPLQQAIEKFQALLENVVPEHAVRWIPAKNIHLTLKFLGEIPEDQVPLILDRLSGVVAGHPPLPYTLGGFGCFPRIAKPRILHLAVETPDQMLLSLQGAIEDVLAESGYPREDRPFKPHVTIGRVQRSLTSPALAELGERLKKVVAPPLGGAQAGHVTLLQSRLLPSGAEYSPLGTAVLGEAI